MKKDFGKFLTALLAVLFGVFGLIKFVGDVGLIIGLLSLTFGLVAIIWTVRALTSLSKGTTLYNYTFYFLFSLLFIVLFSIWDTAIELFQWTGALIYPKYFLVTIAYLVFVFAAYNILYMGRQFGFKVQVSKMKLKKKPVMKKVKKKKK